jgi:hypothetical protein
MAHIRRGRTTFQSENLALPAAGKLNVVKTNVVKTTNVAGAVAKKVATRATLKSGNYFLTLH